MTQLFRIKYGNNLCFVINNEHVIQQLLQSHSPPPNLDSVSERIGLTIIFDEYSVFDAKATNRPESKKPEKS